MSSVASANPYLYAMGITQWVAREAREHKPSVDPVIEKAHRTDLHDPRKAAHQLMADLLNDSPKKSANKLEKPLSRPIAPDPQPEAVVLSERQVVEPMKELRALSGSESSKSEVEVDEHCVATCERCLNAGSDLSSSPRQSDWLVIGEPEGKTKRLDEPAFEGASELLLKNMLAAVGVKIHLTNVWNLCTDFRPLSRTEYVKPKVCLGCLERQIALVQPRVVLLVGRFAVDALLGVEGALRGRTHYSNRVPALAGTPVVVTYHPAYLLTHPADKAKCWADLKLALAAVPSV